MKPKKAFFVDLLPAGRSWWIRHSLVPWLFCSIVLLLSSPALAQSCPLCKTALIGQAESTLDAINLGILVLLFPPLILMSSIVIVAFRHDQN